MKTIYEFFAEHDCSKQERAQLIVFLAERRYQETLKLLTRILK